MALEESYFTAHHPETGETVFVPQSSARWYHDQVGVLDRQVKFRGQLLLVTATALGWMTLLALVGADLFS